MIWRILNFQRRFYHCGLFSGHLMTARKFNRQKSSLPPNKINNALIVINICTNFIFLELLRLSQAKHTLKPFRQYALLSDG